MRESLELLNARNVQRLGRAAGDTNFQRLRRIMTYAGTHSASTPDGSMERLGTVLTTEGRRSGRLASLAATGGGMADEDAETQAIVLHNLQVARTVVKQLRAALPPPTLDDFPAPTHRGCFHTSVPHNPKRQSSPWEIPQKPATRDPVPDNPKRHCSPWKDPNTHPPRRTESRLPWCPVWSGIKAHWILEAPILPT